MGTAVVSMRPGKKMDHQGRDLFETICWDCLRQTVWTCMVCVVDEDNFAVLLELAPASLLKSLALSVRVLVGFKSCVCHKGLVKDLVACLSKLFRYQGRAHRSGRWGGEVTHCSVPSSH